MFRHCCIFHYPRPPRPLRPHTQHTRAAAAAAAAASTSTYMPEYPAPYVSGCAHTDCSNPMERRPAVGPYNSNGTHATTPQMEKSEREKFQARANPTTRMGSLPAIPSLRPTMEVDGNHPCKGAHVVQGCKDEHVVQGWTVSGAGAGFTQLGCGVGRNVEQLLLTDGKGSSTIAPKGIHQFSAVNRVHLLPSKMSNSDSETTPL